MSVENCLAWVTIAKSAWIQNDKTSRNKFIKLFGSSDNSAKLSILNKLREWVLKLFGSRESAWIVNFEKGREYVLYQFGSSENSARKRENLTCSGCFELCYVCSDGKRPTPHSSPKPALEQIFPSATR